ncbi:MAG: hypothetical protein A2498_12995 [Lentisphaerae bacterium RIFOXYC12_FULL_60_16]|nr:MAG: hypothetical protein A2498_12995 [Lentisphaerae bacterium RIFOXYC12_FULL_60_16]OGV85753.1 MAG: hypothetical protein A2340_04135 [Lentisphaerae bacterium RIFOXYB12_FULL_60_10]
MRIDTLSMPAASLGLVNPLPTLAAPPDVHATPQMDPAIPDEDARYVGYGTVNSCLPYLVQDGYNRTRRTRKFRVAILENEILRATFLLERGGRLWSLFHKPSGRELLDVNPVFQPANLAIRNAWFSGGVEWNIGLVGHCPFTCDPVFAARVEGPDGSPVLRLYEFERIRCVPFQIDAWLPDGSPVLLVHVRIRNPNTHIVPMYWWSNISVPETPDTRVIVPASHSYRFAYQGGLMRIPFPPENETDASYASRMDRSMDFFFRIPDGRRPWITALDGTGRGLVQTSTDRLKGRKLFVWGNGAGGRRWQEFLSVPGHAYLEIQAGLARTQAEHLPMPPATDWSWLEAYGLMEADPAIVHGPDWSQACETLDRRVEQLIPRQTLEAEHRRAASLIDIPPTRLIQQGSGWGALEEARRRAQGLPGFGLPGLVFDSHSLTQEQAPWLELIRGQSWPETDPGDIPAGCMVQPEWHHQLEAAMQDGRASHDPIAWLHLGIMRYHAGNRAGARTAWEQSYRMTPSAWAARNLAILSRQEQRVPEAVDWMVAALLSRPDLLPLVAECGRLLMDTGRSADWLALLKLLPASVRKAGRVRLLEAQAALVTDDLKRIERILRDAPVVIDLREGEQSLSELWFALHERTISRREQIPVDDALRARVRRDFPPPPAIDFRMSV